MRFTSYFDIFLREGEADGIYSYKSRKVSYEGDGRFLMTRPYDEASLLIKRNTTDANITEIAYTTVRSAFLGSARASVVSAEALKTGKFIETALSDAGEIASEIMMLEIKDSARIDYVLPYATTRDKVPEMRERKLDIAAIDEYTDNHAKNQENRFSNLSVNLYDFEDDKIKAKVFNDFTKKVQCQVDTCAMAKYYAGARLGMRDVIQQLESAIHWDSKQAKEKMLRALGKIAPDGRPPRQFALPTTGETNDDVLSADLREYIDQGNWIIACFYSYLAWTGDYSILDEVISYYDMDDSSHGTAAEQYFLQIYKSDKTGSVLEHLIKIMEYYEGKLDTEDGTGCMRILFGDWNDSLDALGTTKNEGKQYGTGVSMMATLHYYQNLTEMIEILGKVGGYDELIAHYNKIKEKLAGDVVKNAIDINEKGETRLLHGWGDHKSYKVGSFSDSDGKDRISFAPNAFWVTSGLIKETPGLKSVIIDALHKLESRFGIKTLIPAFTRDSVGVGRISTMLEGEHENSTAYSHAAMFSIAALYGLGDTEFAWRMFTKALAISNENTTASPFVMANSYLDNPQYGMNGQSGLDWFTGSGAVYIKNLIRCVLGVNASLEGVIIRTPRTMPCRRAEADMLIKGKRVRFEYKNENSGERRIELNGKPLEAEYDELAQVKTAFIPNDAIADGMVISVID